MNKREQEIKDKKSNRFTYDSSEGLSVVSKGKEEKSDTKEKETKKDESK